MWFCSDEHVTFAPADGATGRRRPGPRRPGPRRPDDGHARGRLARRRRRGLDRWADRPARLGMTETRARCSSPGSPSALAWRSRAVSPWIGQRARGAGRPPMRSLMPWAALSAAPLAVGAARHRSPPAWPSAVGRRRRRRRRDGRAARAPPRRQPHARSGGATRCRSSTPTCCTSTTASPTSPPSLAALRRRRRHVQRADADARRPPARRSALAAAYPYRIELPARHGSGTGLWSRYPVTEQPSTDTKHHTVVADVDAPGRRRAGHRRPHPEPDRPPRPVGGRPRAARRPARSTGRR